jgi:hypothetical protein
MSDYSLEDLGSIPSTGQHRASVFRPALFAHPASYPMDTVGPSPGDKVRPGREAAEVKNEYKLCLSTLPLGACISAAGQLYLYFAFIPIK